MVKQILSFIRWQFSRWTWADYLWMTGAFMIGAGYNGNQTVFLIGVIIAASMIFGAVIKSQWQSWKRERQDLLNTIKNEQ